MELLGNNLVAFCGTKKYNCIKCDYTCSKKYNWDKHIMTAKHNMEITGSSTCGKKWQKVAISTCNNCKKEFKTQAGLWKHKQKCTNNDNDIDKDELIITLLKQNAELIKGQQDMMVKLTENGINNHSNNTTTNSHNKAFNLNLFLNETCKDAMNIMDFVDSIKLQLSDLEKMGEVGYTQGISNIITTNLKALDITQRPVHCTDKKRGIMYIKDENKWEKEDDEKTKLKHLIIRVSNKNIKLLPQFRDKYPDYKVSTSRTSDKYDKIVLEAMGGSGDNDKEKTEKIIQNISKCVVIDKYE
jgi:hypothetical protein